MELKTCSGCNLKQNDCTSQKCIVNLKKSDVFLLREKKSKFLDKLADGRILVLTRTQYSDIFQIMETYQNLISNQQHYQFLDLRFEYQDQLFKINMIDKYIDLSLNKSELFIAQNLILSSNTRQFLTSIYRWFTQQKILGRIKQNQYWFKYL